MADAETTSLADTCPTRFSTLVPQAVRGSLLDHDAVEFVPTWSALISTSMGYPFLPR
jgi:hypothetical protein